MSKIHVSEAGVRPCEAPTPQECPVGYAHFDNEDQAKDFYEKMMTDRETPLKGHRKNSVNSSSSFESFSAKPIPINKGYYHAFPVPQQKMIEWENKLRAELGDEYYNEVTSNRHRRDRGKHYHITLLSPQETKLLKANGKLSKLDEVGAATFETLGVGEAQSGDNTAFFAVVRSPHVNAWRESVGLEKRDLHITIGFDGKDVYDQPKDESSLFLK